jgi:hypothetical protein
MRREMKPHPINPAILVLDTDAYVVAKYTSIGTCPICYITANESVLCATCVQDNQEACCNRERLDWFVVKHAPNWEDPELVCSQCAERIESAYAENAVSYNEALRGRRQ